RRLKTDAVKVFHADFLHQDLGALPSPCKVVSNLPYSAGAPITLRLMEWGAWDTAVLMFQKEVAERVVAGPGGRDYGPFTIAVQMWADAEYLFTVTRERFRPPPKVDSGVVRLTRRAQPLLPEGLPPAEFTKVVRGAFSQRRKMAAKCLAGALGLERAKTDAAFAEAGLDVTARAETIPLEGFVRLTLALREKTPC
ncbi:16S rRNA (adenine(1518)-N(6)/adenine(1519)-N(6))-dimethyltransferase, partial [bacterium]